MSLEKQIILYSKVLEVSKMEENCLKESIALKDVFTYIPMKMELLKEINELDEQMNPFKDEIFRLNKQSEKPPLEILNLIKKVEAILEETLKIDANNNDKIMEIYQKKTIPANPLNIFSDKKLRAMKAYGKD